MIFVSASGSIEIEDLKKDVSALTASGNITARNIDGDLDIATASGNLIAETISGSITAATASGNVRADSVSAGINLTTASGNVTAEDVAGVINVSTASGNLDVRDAVGSFQINTASAEHNLVLNTASGNAVLDYNGNPVQGYFEFTARVNNGRIVSPFAFDVEETFTQSGQQYWRKSFTRGSSTPHISINTASGRAELREEPT